MFNARQFCQGVPGNYRDQMKEISAPNLKLVKAIIKVEQSNWMNGVC